MSGSQKILLIGTSALLTTLACSTGSSESELEDVYEEPSVELGLAIHGERVVVGFHHDAPARVITELGEHPVRVLHTQTRLATIPVPADMDAAQLVTQLRKRVDVRFAELDRVRTISAMQSDDPGRAYQWNLDQVDVDSAWDSGHDGSGVIVAVIDTGVSEGGPDGLMFSRGQSAGWDFVDDDSDPSDEHGHGTHVAGTIGQATGNSTGVAGIAHGSQIMAIRVLDANGSGYSSDVASGILWAADHGADVINLSLGSSVGSQAEQDAVAYAAELGIVVVAATGNEYQADGVSFPAAYPEVIAVGASNGIDEVVPYSNRGPEVDLVAPGGDFSRDDNEDGIADGIVQETIIDGSWDYYFFQGTSMASPHVAGAAALLMGMGADAQETRDILTRTSVDITDEGIDNESGWGRLDVGAAVAELEARLDSPDEEPVEEEPVEEEPVVEEPVVEEPVEEEPGDRLDDDGRPVDPDPGDDFTAPEFTSVRAFRDGARAIIRVQTDEVAGVMVCERGTQRCARSPYGEEHEIDFRTPHAELDLLARDPTGNVRVIPLAL